MNNSKLFFRRMLPVAIALGTAWAARGQIGHEYGAAWAGAIGVLAVVTLSGRPDWIRRLPTIVALGAMAWGSGGVISYGKVVGFGHTGDYLNTSYGLVMLLFIGGMYGFLGGGITGLTLESTTTKKIDWAVLITQLFVGAYLSWGLFVFELEWLMTPPRSELWAACLGACLSLGWYLYRNGYAHALRTALFAALGAGFGFGFGNFLQRMGQTSAIPFNWWNVMEYSIGFFGGLGMAYGIFSNNSWPETSAPNKVSNTAGMIFLIILLPALNLIEGISTKTMTATGSGLGVTNPAAFASNWQTIMWCLSFCFMLFYLLYFNVSWKNTDSQFKAALFTLLFLGWYILISNFISATWLAGKFSSQHLYWVNLLILWFFLRHNAAPDLLIGTEQRSYSRSLLMWWAAALILILLVSYIAVAYGRVSPGAQPRFE